MRDPRLEIDPPTRQRVAARIRQELGVGGPLFGVHPGYRNSAYNWPEHCYAELVCRLAKHGRVMITGSPEERPKLERIVSRLTESARCASDCLPIFNFWNWPRPWPNKRRS